VSEAVTPLHFADVSKSFARGRERVQALDHLEITLQAGSTLDYWGLTVPVKPP
jgi:hypothetical protein